MSRGGLTFYGNSKSGNCLKPKWVADYLSIPYDWVEVDIVAGETKTPEWLAMNPVGQLPFLKWDDGRSLTESNAMMLYFAEGSDLIPQDAFARAQMNAWMFWEQYSHEPTIAVRRWRLSYMKRPEAELDPALLSGGYKALELLHSQLAHTDFLVGDSMSCADISLIAYTRWADEGGFDLAAYPAISPWIHRVEDALNIPRART